MMTLERILRITPAWDRRDPNPAKNYGIHGCDLLFVVKGDVGALELMLSTNWFLSTVEQTEKSGLLPPQYASLGSHSKEPEYEGQEAIRECSYTGGPCYVNCSPIQGLKLFDLLVEKGSEELWLEMEKLWHDRFDNAQLSLALETNAEDEELKVGR